MRWTYGYSCREFHKLSIESKIIKIRVPSKKLWSKHEEADFCEAPGNSNDLAPELSMLTGTSDAPNLVKWAGLLDILVENFISFPQSPRSSNSELRAKSYDQNMKKLISVRHRKFRWPSTGTSDGHRLNRHSNFRCISQDLHRVQDHRNRSSEQKVMTKTWENWFLCGTG